MQLWLPLRFEICLLSCLWWEMDLLSFFNLLKVKIWKLQCNLNPHYCHNYYWCPNNNDVYCFICKTTTNGQNHLRHLHQFVDWLLQLLCTTIIMFIYWRHPFSLSSTNEVKLLLLIKTKIHRNIHTYIETTTIVVG